MGSASQLYSLTWGEFGTSLVSAVQRLRFHGDMVDVTLAAGGRSFPAHKIVLCAASPFLLNLLKSTPCKHPVVLLAGVGAHDLEAILEFVYRGEVSVDPNQLPSLLQAAHCLNIQGLAPGSASSEKPEDVFPALPVNSDALTRDVINSFLPLRRRKRTKHRTSSGSGGTSKWPRTEQMDGKCSRDSENQPCERDNEENERFEPSQHGTSESQKPIDTETAKTDEGQSQDESGKKNSVSDQPAICPLCGATLRQSRNLRRHLELLHFGVGRSPLKTRSRKSRTQESASTSASPALHAEIQLSPSIPSSQSDQIESQSNLNNQTQSGSSNGPESNCLSTSHSPSVPLTQSNESNTHIPISQSNIHSSSSEILMTQPNVHNLSTSHHNNISQANTIQVPHHSSISSHNHTHVSSVHALSQHNTSSSTPISVPQHIISSHSNLNLPMSMSHMAHMSSPHLVSSHLSRLDNPHGLLNPMSSPHDSLFRQHHSDLLRGAALYVDNRGESHSSSQPSMRQEVS